MLSYRHKMNRLLLITIWFLSSVPFAILVVIVSVRFTNLLFSDVPYVLTDVIVLARRRKTDDLSSQLKLRNCAFSFFFVSLAFPFFTARFTPAACAQTAAPTAALSGGLLLARKHFKFVFLEGSRLSFTEETRLHLRSALKGKLDVHCQR